MIVPKNLKYSEAHVWFDEASGKVGLSYYAQDEIYTITHFDLLVSEDDDVKEGEEIAVVTSVKTEFYIYSPTDGLVVAVNGDLADTPEAINSDPYGEAWMIQLEGGSAGDMMDSAAYEKYCEERSH